MSFSKRIKSIFKYFKGQNEIKEKLTSAILVLGSIVTLSKGEQLGAVYLIPFIAVLLSLAILYWTFATNKQLPKNLYYLLVVIFSGILVSTVFSKVPDTSFHTGLYSMVFAGIFFVSYLLGKTNFKYTLFTYFFSYSMGLYVVMRQLLTEILSGRMGQGKLFIGPFFWHNQMAAYLLYLIPLPLSILIFSKRKNSFLWILVLMVLIFSLTMTQSRASFLIAGCLIITLLLFGYFKKILSKSRLTIIILSAFVAILLGLYLGNSNDLITRYKSIVSEVRISTRTSSGNIRTDIIRQVPKIVKDFPLTGLGPGVFGDAYRAYQNSPWLYANSPHSSFLQLITEYGLPVTLLVAFFAFKLIKNTLPKVNNTFQKLSGENLKSVVTVSLIFAVSAGFVHSFIDVDFDMTGIIYIFTMYLGLLLGKLTLNTKGLKPSKNIGIIFAIALLFWAVAHYKFHTEIHLARTNLLQRNYDMSLSHTNTAGKYFEYSYQAHFLSGKAYSYQGEYQKSLGSFNSAKMFNMFASDPYYEQAIIHLKQNNTEKGEVLLYKAIELNPYYQIYAYNDLIILLLATGKNDAAAKLMKTTVENIYPINNTFLDFYYIYRIANFNQTLGNIYYNYSLFLYNEGQAEKAHGVTSLALEYLNPQSEGLKILLNNIENTLSK